MQSFSFRKSWRMVYVAMAAAFLLFGGSFALHAQSQQPDVVVFTNGDQLSGKFVRAVGDTVVFHSDILGDVNIGWDKIKELRTAQKVAVLEKGVRIRDRHLPPNFPVGTASVENQEITVQSATAAIAPIPVKNAQVVVDETT